MSCRSLEQSIFDLVGEDGKIQEKDLEEFHKYRNKFIRETTGAIKMKKHFYNVDENNVFSFDLESFTEYEKKIKSLQTAFRDVSNYDYDFSPKQTPSKYEIDSWIPSYEEALEELKIKFTSLIGSKIDNSMDFFGLRAN